MIEHHKENVGSAGDFNSFLVIEKDLDKKAGYVDKVVIHYLVEDRSLTGSADAPNLLSNMSYGAMFAASLNSSTETVDGESGLLDPNDLLQVRARSGMAGSVTIPIKHLIKENVTDLGERDGRVYLWIKTPDVTSDDDMIFRFYIEVWGRWIAAAGL
jgi:hypothetical protein